MSISNSAAIVPLLGLTPIFSSKYMIEQIVRVIYRTVSFLGVFNRLVEHPNHYSLSVVLVSHFPTSIATNSIFSTEMYKVGDLNKSQRDRLQKTHNEIIVPIVRHYRTFNNIKMTDVDVYDVSTVYPGKEINIAIQNISPAKLASDIDKDLMGVKTKLYKYELTNDGYVRLMVR